MHEDGIFPIPKLCSDLDVGLPFGAGDADYLTGGIRSGLSSFRPRVARFALRHGCALVALPAGGYSPESSEITAAGFAKIAAAADVTSP